MFSSFWRLLGYGAPPMEAEEIRPAPKQVERRHLLMRQIRESHIKLRSIGPIDAPTETLYAHPPPQRRRKPKKNHRRNGSPYPRIDELAVDDFTE